jgi:hypothetical protein
MKKIFEDKLEELDVEIKSCEKNHHFTIVELFDVNRMPRRKGVGKVKDHLRSIYREFIRKGVLKLTLNNEELKFEDPKILNVPQYDKPDDDPILWRKEIDFELEEGLSVHGFVANQRKGIYIRSRFCIISQRQSN